MNVVFIWIAEVRVCAENWFHLVWGAVALCVSMSRHLQEKNPKWSEVLIVQSSPRQNNKNVPNSALVTPLQNQSCKTSLDYSPKKNAALWQKKKWQKGLKNNQDWEMKVVRFAHYQGPMALGQPLRMKLPEWFVEMQHWLKQKGFIVVQLAASMVCLLFPALMHCHLSAKAPPSQLLPSVVLCKVKPLVEWGVVVHHEGLGTGCTMSMCKCRTVASQILRIPQILALPAGQKIFHSQ